ncbi:toxin-antitoxin system, toxin component, PIN domain protein [Cardiobacterium valvarum F0432]|uniref:Toxin-antitoxin system, toxin component, PIN domain protein n=1 Tax=Cardiobacterium valvarum F0432 TaxID=797473 RepID=G9ZJD0_9GAMM|nr:toxin-antitoxin system, toxin component, PIN domain protein [Cardiobacterium valvarum F0432]
MILLDTNVISEPTHAQPDAAVVAWLNGQRLSTLYLSTITLAEMRFGIAQLPEGRKKKKRIFVRLRNADSAALFRACTEF